MNIEGGTHHSPAAKPIRQLYQNAQNVKLNEPTTPKKKHAPTTSKNNKCHKTKTDHQLRPK